MSQLWYYLQPGQQEPVGPIAAQQIRHLLASHKISQRTLIWTEGMEQWEELGKNPNFQKTERIASTTQIIMRKSTAMGQIPNEPKDPGDKPGEPKKS